MRQRGRFSADAPNRPVTLALAMKSMKLNDPQNYTIRLLSEAGYELSQNSKKVKFSKPASARGVAKLYTLSHDGKLLYVGIAQQPMAGRLNFGFKAEGKGGYHGYKWKNLTQTLKLSVWTASLNNEYVSLREMETIEAEVAYLCRHQSSQWPEYQHEIHFFPSSNMHREAAMRIYNHAIGKNG